MATAGNDADETNKLYTNTANCFVVICHEPTPVLSCQVGAGHAEELRQVSTTDRKS